jgi:exodeoxyribonuclease VII small subunit
MAAAKKKPFVYAEAASELQAILDEIENGTADVDVLSEKVERAAELIRGCREALAGTELRVRKIVEELAAEGEQAPPAAEADEG